MHLDIVRDGPLKADEMQEPTVAMKVVSTPHARDSRLEIFGSTLGGGFLRSTTLKIARC